MDHHYFQSNPSNIQSLNYTTYRPDGSTALLDAIGDTITQLSIQTQSSQLPTTVVVVILTDGYENSSRLYNLVKIRNMISSLEESGKWTFSFLGADFDAIHTSQMLNIRRENVMNFDKSDYMNMMNDVSASIRNYASEKSSGNLKRDIFDIFRDKERRKK